MGAQGLRAVSLSPHQAHPEVFILPPPCSAATLWRDRWSPAAPARGSGLSPGREQQLLRGPGVCAAHGP